jgi:hypothetical protein
MRITTTWTNKNPDTIWNRLAAKLGREPTNAEAEAEVRRILDASMVTRAEKGKLKHQRNR